MSRESQLYAGLVARRLLLGVGLRKTLTCESGLLSPGVILFFIHSE